MGCFLLMILTDGGIHEREVYYVTTDKTLATLFTELSRTLWSITPMIMHYKRGKHSWMKLRIKNSLIAETAAKLTKNKMKIPEFIANETDSHILSKYLKIVASTDGGIAFYRNKRKDGYTRTERHVIIGCKNTTIQKQLQEMFSRLGIKTRIVR